MLTQCFDNCPVGGRAAALLVTSAALVAVLVFGAGGKRARELRPLPTVFEVDAQHAQRALVYLTVPSREARQAPEPLYNRFCHPGK